MYSEANETERPEFNGNHNNSNNNTNLLNFNASEIKALPASGENKSLEGTSKQPFGSRMMMANLYDDEDDDDVDGYAEGQFVYKESDHGIGGFNSTKRAQALFMQ